MKLLAHSKSVLVKRRASLGDVLNTTPVVHRLRAEDPEALIAVETFHARAYTGNADMNILQGKFEAEDWDQVIDLNLCFERNRRIHQVDANMLHAFGNTDGDKSIVLTGTPITFDFPWERTVVIHPNRSWAQRTLPQLWWNSVVTMLESTGLFPVITGTAQDWKLFRGVDLQDKLSLAQQVTLISQAAVFLTGASGLVTVAGATLTPVVPLLSMTPWENFLPYRQGEIGWNMWPQITPLGCYGCDVNEPAVEYYPCPRGDNACMASFNPEFVVRRVLEAIEGDKRKTLTTPQEKIDAQRL